jgi:hypothetical protein
MVIASRFLYFSHRSPLTTLHQGTLLCGISLNTVEMAINWVLPVRVVQLIFAIIVLGLTAYGKFRIPTHSLSSE